MPTIADRMPIAWNPLKSVRWNAVNTANPNKVFSLLVPTPITRDPNGIFPVRAKLGRHLVDVGGRFPIDNETWDRVGDERFRESLVQRTTSQGFNTDVIQFWLLKSSGSNFLKTVRGRQNYFNGFL